MPRRTPIPISLLVTVVAAAPTRRPLASGPYRGGRVSTP
jgi:hypothetical protein